MGKNRPALPGRLSGLTRAVRKMLNARLCTSEDQGMDIVRALVRIDDFQVHQVLGHAGLVRDPIAAEHVARGARNVERFAA